MILGQVITHPITQVIVYLNSLLFKIGGQINGNRQTMFIQVKPKTVSRLGVLFLLALSTTMRSAFGPATLRCEKNGVGSADCRLTKSVALGLIDIQEISINQVTEAVLDTQTREIKTERYTTDQTGRTHRDVISRDVTVYGIRLMGDSTMVFNDYDYSRRAHLQDVDKINSFLASSTPQLTIREIPDGLHLFALGSLGLAVFIFIKIRGWQ